MASEIIDLAGKFEVQEVIHAQDREELIIYAKVGSQFQTVRSKIGRMKRPWPYWRKSFSMHEKQEASVKRPMQR